jgi:NAD(P)-dependent dehydrogenase (short-subunit alcohol dehydrogenase family)
VNNAALAWAAPTLDFPLDAWDRSFATNVRGPFWLARQVARHMREHGGGSIVNVSSLNAFFGASDASAFVTGACLRVNGGVGALVPVRKRE